MKGKLDLSKLDFDEVEEKLIFKATGSFVIKDASSSFPSFPFPFTIIIDEPST